MTRLPESLIHDPELNLIFDAVEAGGKRVWLVGGAVRNALLGQPADDIDIATDARPDEVMKLAEAANLRTIPTGIDHGTITVIANSRSFEVTTLRRDVKTDGRRAVVAFSDDISVDARRRDFTINALYADRSGVVIDPVGGLPDLQARHVRFVGVAQERIREDYLRILRFFRFLAWYGRQAEPQAVAACSALKDGLQGIARERIGAEIKKLLAAPDPVDSVRLMAETGVLACLLPDAGTDSLAALVGLEGREGAPPAWPRRLAALTGGKGADTLRLSRNESRVQAALAGALDAEWSLAEAGYRLGRQLATDYALLLAAGRGGSLPDEWREIIVSAANARLPISASDLIPQLKGQQIGRGLKAAEELWIAGGFTPTAPALIDAALQAGNNE